ncbi:MAG: hypothetical protein WCS86_01020 [Candidatus Paceibacterota bacterium]
MKKYSLYGVVLVVVIIIVAYFVINKKVVAPVVINEPIELCFAKFGTPNERGYFDKFTLRMILDGEKVTGELNSFPAEKDSKVGKFEGTVSAVDKTMMARTADVWWNTFGEGMNVMEEQRIIFGEGVANIGFGGTADRGDGVYAYVKNPDIHYTLALNDVACSDLTERDNVEKYIKENITKLSPVKAVLGGTWYVLSVALDLNKKSGTVMYEDGHVQEKKNFVYTVNENKEVVNMIIK